MRILKRLGVSALVALLVGASQAGWAAGGHVTIGYQLMDNPWKVSIVDKAFEKATGYDIKWVQFSSGSQAAQALASGAVQITSIGSVPLTSAVSNGVDAKLFWILEGIGANEQLVARKGTGVKTISDLAGKRVGVPVGSTSDLDLFYALQNAKVEANVLDMQPDAIVAAWSRGNIDAAFVWDPALSKIKQSGHVLTSSGAICKSAGICTFDGLAVASDWAKKNPQFMQKFVNELDRITRQYTEHPKQWTADSEMVKKIAKLNGADPSSVPQVLAGYEFLTASHQASKQWLGGGALKSMQIGAKFLTQRGAISEAASSYAPYVDAQWVRKTASAH